jgi:probable phosphoglycerate mutase
LSTFLLIRHGETDAVGKRLSGRTPGVHLNGTGRAQAEVIAKAIGRLAVDAVYGSPLERAAETAAALCETSHVGYTAAAEFTEMDFGAWTNCTFDELEAQPLWESFNSHRSETVPPNGESMRDVQTRAAQKLEELRRQQQTVAVVTHCDVIRAVLAHYLGMPLDMLLRFDCDPASVSVLDLNDWQSRVRLINGSAEDAARFVASRPIA